MPDQTQKRRHEDALFNGHDYWWHQLT